MKNINVQPLDLSVNVETGMPLLTALVEKDLKIQMSCGGRGLCSTCHIHVVEGQEGLSPVEGREAQTLGFVVDRLPESRLACQAKVYGDGVVVSVPESMYIERAEDLMVMLGTRAPENILHPVTGRVLIPKGKLITRTLLEESRSVKDDLRRARGGDSGHGTERRSGPSSSSLGTPGNPPTPRRSSSSSAGVGEQSSTSRGGFASMPSAKRGSSSWADMELSKPPGNTTHVAPGGAAQRTPTQGPSTLRSGLRVDKYLLMERIGRGGSGVVFRGMHTKLNNPVAIKFIRTDVLSSDETALERFVHEAQLLAQLTHPNVVRVLDFEDDPARPYVVMEYVDGTDLSELIRQGGRISHERSVEIALQVIDGLEAASELGIVHRDVKPGNILVNRKGDSKLVDFGLAVVSQSEPESEEGSGALSPGQGTLGYMSPEQIKGEPVDHRSDMYSLGATLYQMITGRLPFLARSANDMAMMHLNEECEPVHTAVAGVPETLSEVIREMMRKSPDDRYATYQELRKHLRAI